MRLPSFIDRRALQTAVRTTAAVAAGFTIGRYVLDNDQFAVFAAFTSMALLAFADYGGPLRLRLVAVGVTLAAALPLVALGTVATQIPWGGALGVGAAAFAVAYSVVLGGYFAAGANAVILFVVLAAGIPAPDDALAWRLAGTALGGALAAAATVLLWPARPERDVRPDLARAAAALGNCLGGPDPAAALAAARDDVAAARAAVGGLWRRGGVPTPSGRALERLALDLDRVLGRVAAAQRHGPPPAAARGLIGAAHEALGSAADSLAGRRPRRDPVEIDDGLPGLAAEARATLAARADPDGAMALADEVERTALAGETAAAAALAALDAEIAAGRRPRSRHPAVAELLDPSPLTVARRRLRHNLTPRSVHFRNALRLAVALAVAMALVLALDLQHGFWVVLATLTVVRSAAASTSASARQAALGTAVGFVVSVVVILGAESDSHLYATLLGVVILGAAYAARAGGLVAGQAGLTVFVVVLFSLLAPSDWTLALVRVEDVVAGALVGVAIGLLAWPRGAFGELPAALAEVIECAAAEARCAARRAFGEAGDCDPARLRTATLASARRAGDDLAVALAERGLPAAAEAWPALLTEADVLPYASAWAEGILAAGPPPPRCAALARDLAHRADAAADGYGAAAAALRRGDGPPPEPAADDAALVDGCAGPPPAPDEGGALVRLLALRHWVRELEAGVGRLGRRVESVRA